MIDFRYHVVSLVSVFVALAVGIVLGAGPLAGPLTQVTTDGVDQLRATIGTLRSDLASSQKSLRERDDFVAKLTPNLVARQLLGRSVAVVTMPGADGDTVKSVMTTLEAAGARVTARVDLKSAWTSADATAARNDLLATLAPGSSSSSSNTGATGESTAAGSLGVSAGASAAGLVAGSGAASPRVPTPRVTPTRQTSAPTTLAALLARDLLTGNLAESAQPDPATEADLNLFARAGMLSLAGDFGGRATQAVLVAPSVETATAAGANATSSASPGTDDSATWLQLITQLDSTGDGAVVLGPASSASAGGVIAALRGDGELLKKISSVDTGGTPMGDLGAVFALREQLAGASGAYGYERGATAVLPASALAP